jgi:hypothetical protein
MGSKYLGYISCITIMYNNNDNWTLSMLTELTANAQISVRDTVQGTKCTYTKLNSLSGIFFKERVARID